MVQKILLVDDDRLFDKWATKVLMRNGFVVRKAETGREALSAVANAGTDEYSLLLVSLKLPDMDASDLVLRCQTMSPRSHILILDKERHADQKDEGDCELYHIFDKSGSITTLLNCLRDG